MSSEIAVARELGIRELRFFSRINYGGGAACATVQQAAMAVVTGTAATSTGIALVGLLGFVLAPLYWMTVTAFKSDSQIVSRTDDLWPTPWSTEQFTNLFTGKAFGTWYVNTILVSVASTVIALVCAALAGYALLHPKARVLSLVIIVIAFALLVGAVLAVGVTGHRHGHRSRRAPRPRRTRCRCGVACTAGCVHTQAH